MSCQVFDARCFHWLLVICSHLEQEINDLAFSMSHLTSKIFSVFLSKSIEIVVRWIDLTVLRNASLAVSFSFSGTHESFIFRKHPSVSEHKHPRRCGSRSDLHLFVLQTPSAHIPHSWKVLRPSLKSFGLWRSRRGMMLQLHINGWRKMTKFCSHLVLSKQRPKLRSCCSAYSVVLLQYYTRIVCQKESRRSPVAFSNFLSCLPRSALFDPDFASRIPRHRSRHLLRGRKARSLEHPASS